MTNSTNAISQMSAVGCTSLLVAKTSVTPNHQCVWMLGVTVTEIFERITLFILFFMKRNHLWSSSFCAPTAKGSVKLDIWFYQMIAILYKWETRFEQQIDTLAALIGEYALRLTTVDDSSLLASITVPHKVWKKTEIFCQFKSFS